jgi:uncharacterized repeat protein (TIGR01451 family)
MGGLRRAAAAAFVVAAALAVSTPAQASSGTADIAATMSGPATASVGQTVSYGVQVTNGGPDAATGIEFTATLSGPGQYTLNVPVPAKCSIRGSTISCEVGGINIPGGSVVFDVGVTMTAAGTVVQNFTATAKQTDPNPSNNSGTITTTVS